IAYMFKHVDDLDNMFELMPILAGTVICIAKIISLTCNSEMIIVRMGSSEIMRYVALMLMQSCRLFFNSWAGQEVTDHSVEVSIAAYDGIWYNASVKVQKLLLFLIARSQKVSQITIAKLYVINLEGFSKPYTRQVFASTSIASFVTAPLTIPLLERYAVCGIIVIATDTIYFALLQHTCGTLAILSYHLAAYDKSKKCFNPTSKGNTDVDNMVHCIQLQIRIERLIYLIETTFAICLSADVGLGVLLQCSGCVRIVTCTELARNGPLVIIQSLRFFFTSWLGQQIIDHSSQISVAAYNGIWYQMSLEAKKMLLLLIMKCQKPYHITAAKLYAICLESYSSV
ncbi:PREDICTED: uncharacterized protein LOC108690299, partial [Atta colombica]|uniref:uncharacterized protein LOC108690299 n=1 Tax=Atta colombica TaxID=520822 RepID=UPI00084C71F1